MRLGHTKLTLKCTFNMKALDNMLPIANGPQKVKIIQ